MIQNDLIFLLLISTTAFFLLLSFVKCTSAAAKVYTLTAAPIMNAQVTQIFMLQPQFAQILSRLLEANITFRACLLG